MNTDELKVELDNDRMAELWIRLNPDLLASESAARFRRLSEMLAYRIEEAIHCGDFCPACGDTGECNWGCGITQPCPACSDLQGNHWFPRWLPH